MGPEGLSAADTSGNASAGGPAHAFQYDGNVGTLYRIWLLNLVFNVLTLGIYSFWGRTRMRRYTAASFALGGDRFEYLGTGGELLRGFLKALPLIIVLYLPLILYPEDPRAGILALPLVFFVYVGLYAAMRYRLSRTLWRGVRGRLSGSAFKYAAITLGTWFVVVSTFGIAIPWADRMTTRYLMGNVWFGNTQAEFTSDPDDLWSMHFVTILPTIALLVVAAIAIGALGKEKAAVLPFIMVVIVMGGGVLRLFYVAAVRRYQFNNLRLGGLRFAADYGGWNMAGLLIGNALILGLTLGLGRPFVIMRDANFLARHITLHGDLEAAAARLHQSQESLSSSGEGIDGLFNADAGVF